MAVTIKDIAARAGVTPTVVSHVLHNKAAGIRVSEATAVRVRQAAEDLHYRVNVLARNLRERSTKMIGVLHGVPGTQPRFNAGSRYFAALMDGIVDRAFSLGYSVSLCPQLYSDRPELAMADGRFDGFICYNSAWANVEMINKCELPVVVVHAKANDFTPHRPSVICDNEQGIDLAGSHQESLGHRHIGFAISEFARVAEGKMREEAFYKALLQRQMETSERECLLLVKDHSSIDEFLKRKLRPTAVIAWSDGCAAEIIERADALGLKLPDDLSLVGFDSTSFCRELRPQLTSISQPLVDMGQTAVDLLVQSILGEAIAPPTVIHPCGVDIRGSTTNFITRYVDYETQGFHPD